MSTGTDAPDPDDPRLRLLVRVATALHEAGAPSYRIEETVAGLGAKFGIETATFAVPTGLTIGLGPIDRQLVRIVRTQPRGPALERLRLVNGVISDIADGEIDPDQAIEQLDELAARPGRWSPLWILLAFAITGLGVGRLAGGTMQTVLGAGIAAAIVGLVMIVLGSRPRRAPLAELAAAFFAALTAAIISPTLGSDPVLVTVAAIIVLVPGLTVTIAMRELAVGHLTAGTARLMGAVKSFVALAFGAGIGEKIGVLVAGASIGSSVPATPHPLWLTLAVGFAALGLLVLLEEAPRMLPWFLAAVFVGWGSIRLAGAIATPEGAAAIAAFVVGLGGNLANRWKGLPAAILVVPGLIVLVPGALGLSGIRAMIERDAVQGLQTIVDASLIGGGLVAGLLVANLVVPPRTSL
jgi:uncharacterized membrane protein YjjP (DUF1212 family)